MLAPGEWGTRRVTTGLVAERLDLTLLQAAGCKKIFAEQVSSVAERGQLVAALDDYL